MKNWWKYLIRGEESVFYVDGYFYLNRSDID
jgi:hypothetical protein